MHTPGAKLSATGLKWIAYACMLLDHFAYAFLYYRSPACIALRTAGKMTLPIFCFLLAEGYCHTKSVRRLRRPFRLRRSSSFGLGLVCVGHCLGLLLHARPQRPPGFAAVRYLYGNCRVALAWRAAQFGLAVSAIFRCVFFAFANAAVRRHARRRCAREVEVLPHLSGAVYLNSAAWHAACALNSAPQCRALAP